MKTYEAIYVTVGKNGPRFHSYWRGRLWPVSRAVAEESFAAGATVYRKNPGESIWTVAPVKVDEVKSSES